MIFDSYRPSQKFWLQTSPIRLMYFCQPEWYYNCSLLEQISFFGLDFAEISQLKKQLSDKFCIKDIGAIFWYLGIKVTRDRANRTLFIDQTPFINWIIKDLRIEKYKSAKIPMGSGTEIIKNQYKSEDFKATKDEI